MLAAQQAGHSQLNWPIALSSLFLKLFFFHLLFFKIPEAKPLRRLAVPPCLLFLTDATRLLSCPFFIHLAQECMDEGLVKREELCIVSKLWNNMHRPENVKASCEASLKRLGLDYLDVFMIHWVCSIYIFRWIERNCFFTPI